MNDMTAQLAAQLRSNPAALRSLMQSPDGQALLRMLSAGDQGASLQKAAQSAVRGNPADLMRMMNQVMKSPAGAELVQRINRSIKQK